MNAKHTPGPWKIDDLGPMDGWQITSADGSLVVNDTADLTDADACLIAAAPELLEALQHLRTNGVSPAAWDIVNAAIAKATQ